MYLPPQFKSTDVNIAAQIMREYPFASLISNDDSGFPYLSHLPLHVELRDQAAGEPPRMVLLGHVAKANPHWKYLQARPQALVAFLGPHAYMSPKVYPDLTRVPTWNYLSVDCKVRARLLEEPLAKDRLLKKLIGDHEPPYAAQWLALAEDYTQKMLSAIVAFELDVESFACKLKLNQHRPEAHAAMRAQYAMGDDNAQALGRWMDQLGIGTASAGSGTKG